MLLGDLDRQSEKGNVSRSDEDWNSGPYVLIALALTFAGFGVSVGITSGVLVSFFVFMFPALVLLALRTSKLQEKKRGPSPLNSAQSGSFSRPSGTTAAA